MTTGIIDFYSTDSYYFSVYIGSDANPKAIKNLWNKYCELVDIDTQKHRGVLNWSYVVSNFVVYLHREVYSHKTIESCNRVLICHLQDYELESIYRYKIEPIKNIYSNLRYTLNQSTKFEVITG